jgi:hypothetical protein
VRLRWCGAQALDCRDALAKALYHNVFLHLVSRINASLRAEVEVAYRTGVLDIFGFEIFQVNRFEQLCINYANEKLQQQFNAFVFKHEQAEYVAEKIRWEHISFQDNAMCVALIEDAQGLLSLLDDECQMQSSDEGFVTKARPLAAAASLSCVRPRGHSGHHRRVASAACHAHVASHATTPTFALCLAGAAAPRDARLLRRAARAAARADGAALRRGGDVHGERLLREEQGHPAVR